MAAMLRGRDKGRRRLVGEGRPQGWRKDGIENEDCER